MRNRLTSPLGTTFGEFGELRMPAEWEPHEATWLAWPTNRQTFYGDLLKEVEEIYVRMVDALLEGEKVHLLVPDRSTAKKIDRRLARHRYANRIKYHYVGTVDVWIRDYGPVFVRKIAEKPTEKVLLTAAGCRLRANRLIFIKWRFNAWGKKYSTHFKDNQVVDKVAELKKYHRMDIPVVLEGGSLDVNGYGLGITTAQCLLNPNRNPNLKKDNLALIFKMALGIRHLIWLKGGIEGDDTDGHVDDVARFVKKDLVLAAVEKDKKVPNYLMLKQNLAILNDMKNEFSTKLRIETLPMPKPLVSHRNSANRLPASYANFYIGNAVVLVPLFNDTCDHQVLTQIKRIFRNKKVVGIDATALVHGLGAFHCITQQQPIS